MSIITIPHWGILLFCANVNKALSRKPILRCGIVRIAIPVSHSSPSFLWSTTSIQHSHSCSINQITLSHATTDYPPIPGTVNVTGASVDSLVPPRREVYGNGRIFDISHRYSPDVPAFESFDGVGQFLWLPNSMKNGSLAKNSEIKLPTHTGTHVGAPGHVFDHYFDAGSMLIRSTWKSSMVWLC